MNRNGLLTLVAILMALALVVRLENTAQAQIIPLPQLGEITYFDYSAVDPLNPSFPYSLSLGDMATINVGSGGTTITTPAIGLGKPTENHPGTVFLNTGTSVLNAIGSGAVISTSSYDPAVMNGSDSSSIELVPREYLVEISRYTYTDFDGEEYETYRIRYGYYFVNDPTRTFYDVEFDEMPENIRDLSYPEGSPFDGDPLFAETNVVFLPPGYVVNYPLVLDPDTGIATAVVSNLQQFTITGPPGIVDDVVVAVNIGFPAGIRPGGDDDPLPPILQMFGGYQEGNLVINQRDSRTPKQPRFVGEGRTLIQSEGIAIENHGTLSVYDARLMAGETGILHEFGGRTVFFDADGNVQGLGSSMPGGVSLYNTQIGEPSWGSNYWFFDPDTGELVQYSGYGIEVDANGKPVQTTTRIHAGDVIMADGVNGRIIAGQDVTTNRNTVGSIVNPSPGAEAQSTNYGILGINGPAIGIHTQAHSLVSFFGPRMENIYYTSLYMSQQVFPGMFDTSMYTYNNDRIQLNENSWIFADTGISFGNMDSMNTGSAIKISIDHTSGIYGSSYGITDRESVLQLWAWTDQITDDEPALIYLCDYSGSFHEIQVDGKVIVGAPNRAGVELNIYNTSELSQADKEKLKNVYYHDPNDPDADRFGNVYCYDPEADDPYNRNYDQTRNSRVAQKFIAYNSQPSRVFWLRMENGDDVPLTYYDYAAQRWTVHPDAPNVRINSGQQSSLDLQTYFRAFDVSTGIGVYIVGSSMAWEGDILPENVDPWSTYFGPTVRKITALGNDSLIAGGNYYNYGAAIWLGGMSDGSMALYSYGLAHVAAISIGENNDVKNLSNMLFAPNSLSQSAKNFQAFDMMTVADRSRLLYDPNLLFDDNAEKFHFDNAGVHGDIVTWYNPVCYLFGGSGTTDRGASWSFMYGGAANSFWVHGHPGPSWYQDEILGIGDTPGFEIPEDSPTRTWYSKYRGTSEVGASFLVGHRDNIGTNYIEADFWTSAGTPGRSLVLDEILLNCLAGTLFGGTTWRGNYDYDGILAGWNDSYGYADSPQHFREALARLLMHGGALAEPITGLSIPELLEGYTRDGTVVTFTNGDIFSGRIYGGGFGDYYNPLGGSVDLRFVDGTTIFNRNLIELVDGSRIVQDAGIRVRDVYVEKSGHLLLNDAVFAVDPFTTFLVPDYAARLIIHDVLNEGIVSGNGVFQIAERIQVTWLGEGENGLGSGGTRYFDGYFINRGALAPGLLGYIGENEQQARELEQRAYQNMLGNPARFVEWDIRGVPGGQYGVITIFGHLYLMDEHIRPVYDPYDPLYNMDEVLPAGQYHATIGNDTIRDVLGKYVAAIASAKATYNPVTHTYDTSILNEGELSREDWQTIAVEKLGTHLSWFSPSGMVDKNTGLPLLTEYEVFEYLTDAKRRTQLQRKMLETVLTSTELRQYDNDPAQRALLNKRILVENGILFELTHLDTLLMRYGFSDVVSVFGTIPPYYYNRYNWGNSVYDWNIATPSTNNSQLVGTTYLGGIVQADRIYDMDANAAKKEVQTSFIIIASEGWASDGSVKKVTSETTDWVFANVDVLSVQMASGQVPAVLTVIDDPNYYRNRISTVKESKHNAKAVARTLDRAMFTNPGLALSFQFGMNDPKVLHNVFRQVASGTRANSVIMNLSSPSDNLFTHIGYGTGGLSTGNRGDVVFRNIQTGQLQQPYGQPAVPPPGQQYAPPMKGQYRGQSPFQRTGSVWGAYTNSTFSMGDDGNSFKYSYYRNGAMIGNEWNLTPSSVIGGVAMFNEGNLQSLSDKVKSQDYVFGLYFVCAPFEQFEVKSFVGGGFQAYKTDRYIRNGDIFIGNQPGGNLFGINDHYDSETLGQSFNYSLEFARPFLINPNFVIRPLAGFEYQNIHQNGYSERKNEGSKVTWSNNGSNVADGYETEGPTQGTYGMSYKGMTFARSLLRFGFNTESYFSRGGIRFRASHVGRLTGDKYPTSRQSFTSGSSLFNVRGGELGNSYFQVGTGANLWLNQERTASLFANGDWNFSVLHGGYNMLNLNGGVLLNF